MNRKREKKLLAAFLVSLLVWMTVLVHGTVPAQQVQLLVEMEEEGRGQREEGIQGGLYELAWWGSLYPRTCLRSAMKLVEEPEDQDSGENQTGESEEKENRIKESEDQETNQPEKSEERENQPEKPEEREAGQGKEPETEEETEQDAGTRIPVKIKWKCMDLF